MSAFAFVLLLGLDTGAAHAQQQCIPSQGGPPWGTEMMDTVGKTKRILYFHGRKMNCWEEIASARIPTDSTWSHHNINYEGNARIGNTGIKQLIENWIVSHCSGTDICVLVGYSAGMNRMFTALYDIQPQWLNIAWISAWGSSLGGTELADYCLANPINTAMCDLFGMHESVDGDLTINHCRGASAYLQNISQWPVYHVAGSHNICALGGIDCGNSHMPGEYGDGAVPVHSAGGYAEYGAYADMCSGEKFTNRSYEQCPLHPVNHYDIIEAGIGASAWRYLSSGGGGGGGEGSCPAGKTCIIDEYTSDDCNAVCAAQGLTCDFSGSDGTHPGCDTGYERMSSSGTCYNAGSCISNYTNYSVQCECVSGGGGGGGGSSGGSCPAGKSCIIDEYTSDDCNAVCAAAGLTCDFSGADGTHPGCDSGYERMYSNGACYNAGSCTGRYTSYSVQCECVSGGGGGGSSSGGTWHTNTTCQSSGMTVIGSGYTQSSCQAACDAQSSWTCCNFHTGGSLAGYCTRTTSAPNLSSWSNGNAYVK